MSEPNMGAVGSSPTYWICRRCQGGTTDPGEASRHECADRKAARALVAFACKPGTQLALSLAQGLCDMDANEMDDALAKQNTRFAASRLRTLLANDSTARA